MSERNGKRRKRHVDHPKDIFNHNDLVHDPGNSSYKCKVLGYFGSKYSKSRSTKDCGYETAIENKFSKHQDNNAIFQNILDEIISQKNNKVRAESEAHKNIGFETDENGLYQIDNRLDSSQDAHIFYTLSHFSELQNCALIFSTNFQFTFTFK